MGKPTGKKKNSAGGKPNDGNGKPNKACDKSSKAFDEDTAVFVAMSQELKEEGNKLFQKRDHEGAMLKYEKALKLLPRNHVDVAYLRNNMAACYMQMGLGEYPRAISECNLALEVIPKYSKALLRRARCYESLNKIDLALKDVNSVLNMEPNNLTALDIQEKIKKEIVEKGLKVDEKFVEPLGERTKKAIEERDIKVDEKCVEPLGERTKKPIEEKDLKVDEKYAKKEKTKKKKNGKVEGKKAEDKVVVEEKVEISKEEVVTHKEVVTKSVKLIFGEDIRWAQLPVNCSVGLVRDIVRDRFPSLKGILIKYRDREGDLVTITTTDELRLAENSGELQGSVRLFIVEVNSDQEPFYEGMSNVDEVKKSNLVENGKMEKEGIDEWIVQFARLFKNHVGFNSDSYLDLHEVGMKLYSEAMEDTISSEEAQEIFVIAAEKFQEMAALALFNWGNVHMSRARKRVFFTEDDSSETILSQIKSAYDWAQEEHMKAGMRYEEALKIKNDFYEGFLALGQQQFEQAKLSWYYAIANKVDLETWNSMEVLQLYNKAEDSMERGMQLLEEMEEQRLNGLSKMDKYKTQLEKLGLDGLLKEISASEASEQSSNMKSQIYLLWGSLLYERSIVEFKLGLPVWEECLEVAVEKFELAGASRTDIAVMIKSHCSNGTALEGLGFRIDELVQAWHEMYDAKRWQIGVPSFRLEPLLRRRPSKLNYILEHV